MPFLITLLPLAIIGGILYMVYKLVSRFLTIREEQNELLKEIIRKMK